MFIVISKLFYIITWISQPAFSFLIISKKKKKLCLAIKSVTWVCIHYLTLSKIELKFRSMSDITQDLSFSSVEVNFREC